MSNIQDGNALNLVTLADYVETYTSRPVVLTREPQSQSVLLGSSIDLTAEYITNQSLDSNQISMQWLKDGSPIPGATNERLFIARSSPSDAGNYQIRFTQLDNVVVSQAAQISVLLECP